IVAKRHGLRRRSDLPPGVVKVRQIDLFALTPIFTGAGSLAIRCCEPIEELFHISIDTMAGANAGTACEVLEELAISTTAPSPPSGFESLGLSPELLR